MRTRILSLSVVVCLLLAFAAAGTGATPVQAQSSTSVVCDSTLITLLYAAEHDYGYHSSMDLSKFETGQFKSLFDKMMSGGTMMATQDAMMAATPAMMATENAMMAATPAMMASEDAMMTALKPGVVQGENPDCTSLRADVEGFLLAKWSGSMMSH